MVTPHPSKSTRKTSLATTLLAVLLAGAYLLADRAGLLDGQGQPSEARHGDTPRKERDASAGVEPSAPSPAPNASIPAGTRQILDAHRRGRSDVIVEAVGTVARTLRDDDDGDRHQRFVLRLEGADHTVLVAHNLDLAPRVPLKEGDTVTLKGEYEHNAEGGVLHWTHRDPSGRHPGGWIRHAEKLYQ